MKETHIKLCKYCLPQAYIFSGELYHEFIPSGTNPWDMYTYNILLLTMQKKTDIFISSILYDIFEWNWLYLDFKDNR